MIAVALILLIGVMLGISYLILNAIDKAIKSRERSREAEFLKKYQINEEEEL